MRSFFRGAIRGIALFLGLFSAANIFVSHFGAARFEDIWWIDASFLPAPVATGLASIVAVLLVLFAFAPDMGKVRKSATVVACLTYMLLAQVNTLAYYSALANHSFVPKIPIPFSLVVAAIFLFVAAISLRSNDDEASGFEGFCVFMFALGGIVLFPLAQMAFFGTTNYAAPADVAIVFGARVYGDGTLSTTVKDRVDTAVALYKEGTVPTILITGGIDEDGVDETEGMRNYAIEQGVGVGDIVIDNKGDNTDASVSNTANIIAANGYKRALAVSQFYHLPRIKMAYRGQRINIRTVPAMASQPIPGNTRFMLREVPAFWVYWVRSGARDLKVRTDLQLL